VVQNVLTQNLGIIMKTTFWEDFTIADRFGIDGIEDTYQRAFNEWRSDVKDLKELILVLNHKIWQYHEKLPQISEVYHQKYNEAYRWATENLNDKDLQELYAYLD